MLLDDNLVFFDGKEIKAEATSEPVALNSLFKPGKNHDAIPMIVTFTEAAAGGTSLKLTLQQADTPDGVFEDVPAARWTPRPPIWRKAVPWAGAVCPPGRRNLG